MGKIRTPIKKTSIEKKNKIIKKGFKLFCKEGYHNVTCVDIAKYSNVSTGIIYQYFNDKRDIFIEGIKNYSNKIMFPMTKTLTETKINKENLNETITKIIDNYIKRHTLSKKAHQELSAMSCLDEEIESIFKKNEMQMTENILKILKENNINTKNQKEKIHIVIGLIDNYCHELIYHKHPNINYKAMKEEVINITTTLLIN